MTGGSQPRRTGLQAEDTAEAFLQQLGFHTLVRHHHIRGGEVDLIVQRGSLIVFVEVKRRRSRGMVGAFESVTTAQQRRIVRAAMDFVQRHGLADRALRFDVIAVTSDGRGRAPRIEHLEGAFDGSAAGSDL